MVCIKESDQEELEKADRKKRDARRGRSKPMGGDAVDLRQQFLGRLDKSTRLLRGLRRAQVRARGLAGSVMDRDALLNRVDGMEALIREVEDRNVKRVYVNEELILGAKGFLGTGAYERQVVEEGLLSEEEARGERIRHGLRMVEAGFWQWQDDSGCGRVYEHLRRLKESGVTLCIVMNGSELYFKELAEKVINCLKKEAAVKGYTLPDIEIVYRGEESLADCVKRDLSVGEVSKAQRVMIADPDSSRVYDTELDFIDEEQVYVVRVSHSPPEHDAKYYQKKAREAAFRNQRLQEESYVVESLIYQLNAIYYARNLVAEEQLDIYKRVIKRIEELEQEPVHYGLYIHALKYALYPALSHYLYHALHEDTQEQIAYQAHQPIIAWYLETSYGKATGTMMANLISYEVKEAKMPVNDIVRRFITLRPSVRAQRGGQYELIGTRDNLVYMMTPILRRIQSGEYEKIAILETGARPMGWVIEEFLRVTGNDRVKVVYKDVSYKTAGHTGLDIDVSDLACSGGWKLLVVDDNATSGKTFGLLDGELASLGIEADYAVLTEFGNAERVQVRGNLYRCHEGVYSREGHHWYTSYPLVTIRIESELSGNKFLTGVVRDNGVIVPSVDPQGTSELERERWEQIEEFQKETRASIKQYWAYPLVNSTTFGGGVVAACKKGGGSCAFTQRPLDKWLAKEVKEYEIGSCHPPLTPPLKGGESHGYTVRFAVRGDEELLKQQMGYVELERDDMGLIGDVKYLLVYRNSGTSDKKFIGRIRLIEKEDAQGQGGYIIDRVMRLDKKTTVSEWIHILKGAAEKIGSEENKFVGLGTHRSLSFVVRDTELQGVGTVTRLLHLSSVAEEYKVVKMFAADLKASDLSDVCKNWAQLIAQCFGSFTATQQGVFRRIMKGYVDDTGKLVYEDSVLKQALEQRSLAQLKSMLMGLGNLLDAWYPDRSRRLEGGIRILYYPLSHEDAQKARGDYERWRHLEKYLFDSGNENGTPNNIKGRQERDRFRGIMTSVRYGLGLRKGQVAFLAFLRKRMCMDEDPFVADLKKREEFADTQCGVEDLESWQQWILGKILRDKYKGRQVPEGFDLQMELGQLRSSMFAPESPGYEKRYQWVYQVIETFENGLDSKLVVQSGGVEEKIVNRRRLCLLLGDHCGLLNSHQQQCMREALAQYVIETQLGEKEYRKMGQKAFKEKGASSVWKYCLGQDRSNIEHQVYNGRFIQEGIPKVMDRDAWNQFVQGFYVPLCGQQIEVDNKMVTDTRNRHACSPHYSPPLMGGVRGGWKKDVSPSTIIGRIEADPNHGLLARCRITEGEDERHVIYRKGLFGYGAEECDPEQEDVRQFLVGREDFVVVEDRQGISIESDASGRIWFDDRVLYCGQVQPETTYVVRLISDQNYGTALGVFDQEGNLVAQWTKTRDMLEPAPVDPHYFDIFYYLAGFEDVHPRLDGELIVEQVDFRGQVEFSQIKEQLQGLLGDTVNSVRLDMRGYSGQGYVGQKIGIRFVQDKDLGQMLDIYRVYADGSSSYLLSKQYYCGRWIQFDKAAEIVMRNRHARVKIPLRPIQVKNVYRDMDSYIVVVDADRGQRVTVPVTGTCFNADQFKMLRESADLGQLRLVPVRGLNEREVFELYCGKEKFSGYYVDVTRHGLELVKETYMSVALLQMLSRLVQKRYLGRIDALPFELQYMELSFVVEEMLKEQAIELTEHQRYHLTNEIWRVLLEGGLSPRGLSPSYDSQAQIDQLRNMQIMKLLLHRSGAALREIYEDSELDQELGLAAMLKVILASGPYERHMAQIERILRRIFACMEEAEHLQAKEMLEFYQWMDVVWMMDDDVWYREEDRDRYPHKILTNIAGTGKTLPMITYLGMTKPQVGDSTRPLIVFTPAQSMDAWERDLKKVWQGRQVFSDEYRKRFVFIRGDDKTAAMRAVMNIDFSKTDIVVIDENLLQLGITGAKLDSYIEGSLSDSAKDDIGTIVETYLKDTRHEYYQNESEATAAVMARIECDTGVSISVAQQREILEYLQRYVGFYRKLSSVIPEVLLYDEIHHVRSKSSDRTRGFMLLQDTWNAMHIPYQRTYASATPQIAKGHEQLAWILSLLDPVHFGEHDTPEAITRKIFAVIQRVYPSQWGLYRELLGNDVADMIQNGDLHFDIREVEVDLGAYEGAQRKLLSYQLRLLQLVQKDVEDTVARRQSLRGVDKQHLRTVQIGVNPLEIENLAREYESLAQYTLDEQRRQQLIRVKGLGDDRQAQVDEIRRIFDLQNDARARKILSYLIDHGWQCVLTEDQKEVVRLYNACKKLMEQSPELQAMKELEAEKITREVLGRMVLVDEDTAEQYTVQGRFEEQGAVVLDQDKELEIKDGAGNVRVFTVPKGYYSRRRDDDVDGQKIKPKKITISDQQGGNKDFRLVFEKAILSTQFRKECRRLKEHPVFECLAGNRYRNGSWTQLIFDADEENGIGFTKEEDNEVAYFLREWDQFVLVVTNGKFSENITLNADKNKIPDFFVRHWIFMDLSWHAISQILMRIVRHNQGANDVYHHFLSLSSVNGMEIGADPRSLYAAIDKDIENERLFGQEQREIETLAAREKTKQDILTERVVHKVLRGEDFDEVDKTYVKNTPWYSEAVAALFWLGYRDYQWGGDGEKSRVGLDVVSSQMGEYFLGGKGDGSHVIPDSDPGSSQTQYIENRPHLPEDLVDVVSVSELEYGDWRNHAQESLLKTSYDEVSFDTLVDLQLGYLAKDQRRAKLLADLDRIPDGGRLVVMLSEEDRAMVDCMEDLGLVREWDQALEYPDTVNKQLCLNSRTRKRLVSDLDHKRLYVFRKIECRLDRVHARVVGTPIDGVVPLRSHRVDYAADMMGIDYYSYLNKEMIDKTPAYAQEGIGRLVDEHCGDAPLVMVLPLSFDNGVRHSPSVISSPAPDVILSEAEESPNASKLDPIIPWLSHLQQLSRQVHPEQEIQFVVTTHLTWKVWKRAVGAGLAHAGPAPLELTVLSEDGIHSVSLPANGKLASQQLSNPIAIPEILSVSISGLISAFNEHYGMDIGSKRSSSGLTLRLPAQGIVGQHARTIPVLLQRFLSQKISTLELLQQVERYRTFLAELIPEEVRRFSSQAWYSKEDYRQESLLVQGWREEALRKERSLEAYLKEKIAEQIDSCDTMLKYKDCLGEGLQVTHPLEETGRITVSPFDRSFALRRMMKDGVIDAGSQLIYVGNEFIECGRNFPVVQDFQKALLLSVGRRNSRDICGLTRSQKDGIAGIQQILDGVAQWLRQKKAAQIPQLRKKAQQMTRQLDVAFVLGVPQRDQVQGILERVLQGERDFTQELKEALAEIMEGVSLFDHELPDIFKVMGVLSGASDLPVDALLLIGIIVAHEDTSPSSPEEQAVSRLLGEWRGVVAAA